MVSATTFTLVGVINKFITTVLLNVMIWDKHSTPLGIFYQQGVDVVIVIVVAINYYLYCNKYCLNGIIISILKLFIC